MDHYLDFVESRRKSRACKGDFLPQAVFSDETAQFRQPAEPSAQDFVEIFLWTGRQNVSAAYLCTAEKRLLMEKIDPQGLFDRYRVLLPPSVEEQRYFFQLQHNEETYYYNRYGISTELPTDGQFRLIRDFQTPDWAKGAVCYQIYVDRFCNGNPHNDVRSGEYSYLGAPVVGETNWASAVADDDFRHFYGGDLQGIIHKLDYLAGLGVEALYLNPIFVSPSSHKYDIQDYNHIDPHYGIIVEDDSTIVTEAGGRPTAYITRTTSKCNLEASDACFAALVEQAHQRHIRVIVDGVFNHCGAFHRWLDRERIYEKDGTGAAWHPDSPYRSYFYWNADGTYEGWWGYANHPKLNLEGCPALYQEILRIGKKWIGAGADGWRLDVAADVGKSEAFNHRFWKDFRRAVKQVNPKALILAEHYGDSNAWLHGDQWDSVMNYDGFMEPVGWFFTGISKHSTEYRADLYNNANAFWQTVQDQMGKMPIQAVMTAMNELSNHDHSRFLTRTNGKTGRLHTDGAQAADQGIQKAVMREAVLLQMTWIGMPTIYYGDEAGMSGWTDPDNRRPYPWGREDVQMIEYHRILAHLRKKYSALRYGSLRALLVQDGILAYGRFHDLQRLAIVCNNTQEEITLEVPVWLIGTAVFGNMQILLQTTRNGFSVDHKRLPIVKGMVTIVLPPQSGVFMKEV